MSWIVSDGPLQSEWYESPTLESLLTLNSNIKKIKIEHFVEALTIAIRSVFYLATATDLLGTQYKREWMPDEDIVLLMSKKPDILFTGGLLFKLSLINKFNKQPVYA